MATITPTADHNGRRVILAWADASTGDTFNSYELGGEDSIASAIQISGTFGGATAVLQVSNDGSSWFTAKDVNGDDISATSAAMFEASLSALYVRPSISGGSSDSLAVTMVMRKAAR